MSPDGRRVVSTSHDEDYKGEIKVWDVATGKCVTTLEGSSPVRRAASAFCTFCDLSSL